ncbi:MAG: 50S ribosomal protein L6 [Pseudomonadota bacterium]
MSRVGKKPIQIPAKTTVAITDMMVTVKGPKGTLNRNIHPATKLVIADNVITVKVQDEDKKSQALKGLTRSLVANMVEGVDKGFERVLEINGIGYRAAVEGNSLVLNLGFSHPVNFPLPAGISAIVEKNNQIKLSGIDKELLGQTAASIRKIRPPEPYKGKGVKYAEEHIQRKAGKTGTK